MNERQRVDGGSSVRRVTDAGSGQPSHALERAPVVGNPDAGFVPNLPLTPSPGRSLAETSVQPGLADPQIRLREIAAQLAAANVEDQATIAALKGSKPGIDPETLAAIEEKRAGHRAETGELIAEAHTLAPPVLTIHSYSDRDIHDEPKLGHENEKAQGPDRLTDARQKLIRDLAIIDEPTREAVKDWAKYQAASLAVTIVHYGQNGSIATDGDTSEIDQHFLEADAEISTGIHGRIYKDAKSRFDRMFERYEQVTPIPASNEKPLVIAAQRSAIALAELLKDLEASDTLGLFAEGVNASREYLETKLSDHGMRPDSPVFRKIKDCVQLRQTQLLIAQYDAQGVLGSDKEYQRLEERVKTLEAMLLDPQVREDTTNAATLTQSFFREYFARMFPEAQIPSNPDLDRRRNVVSETLLQHLDEWGKSTTKPVAQLDGQDGQGDTTADANDGTDNSAPRPDEGGEGGDIGRPWLPQEAAEPNDPDPYATVREQLRINLQDEDLDVIESISDLAHRTRSQLELPLNRPRNEITDEEDETRRRLGARNTNPETVATSVSEFHRFNEYWYRYIEVAREITPPTGEPGVATIIVEAAIDKMVEDIDELILYRRLSEKLENNGPESDLYRGILLRTKVAKLETLDRLPSYRGDVETEKIELQEQLLSEPDLILSFPTARVLAYEYSQRMFPSVRRTEDIDIPLEKRLEIYNAILRDMVKFADASRGQERPETTDQSEPDPYAEARSRLLSDLAEKSTPEIAALRDLAHYRRASARMIASDQSGEPITSEVADEYLRLDTKITERRSNPQTSDAAALERRFFDDNLDHYSGNLRAMTEDIEQFIPYQILSETLGSNGPGNPLYDGIGAMTRLSLAETKLFLLREQPGRQVEVELELANMDKAIDERTTQEDSDNRSAYRAACGHAADLYDKYFENMYPGEKLQTETQTLPERRRPEIYEAILRDLERYASDETRPQPPAVAAGEVSPPTSREQLRAQITQEIETHGHNSAHIKGMRRKLSEVELGSLWLKFALQGLNPERQREVKDAKKRYVAYFNANPISNQQQDPATDSAFSVLQNFYGFYFSEIVITSQENQAKKDTEYANRLRREGANWREIRRAISDLGQDRLNNLIQFHDRNGMAAKKVLTELDIQLI